MNYNECLEDREDAVKERFSLACERMKEIAQGEEVHLPERLKKYFRKTAQQLVSVQEMYQKIADGTTASWTESVWRAEQEAYFQEMLSESYENSYGNPVYAKKELGPEMGKLLSFLYVELREERSDAFAQNLEKMTILHELFLEIYGMFCFEKVTYRQLKETLYWFLYDYAEEWFAWRIYDCFTPVSGGIAEQIMEEGFSLYQYGRYISRQEQELEEALAALPQEQIAELARSYLRTFLVELHKMETDLSEKKTVGLQYPIGAERLVREMMLQCREIGFEPILCGSVFDTLCKLSQMDQGYTTTKLNQQAIAAHETDAALFLDKRMMDRLYACMKRGYEVCAEACEMYAGTICLQRPEETESQGMDQDETCNLSEKQQMMWKEYGALCETLRDETFDMVEKHFMITI